MKYVRHVRERGGGSSVPEMTEIPWTSSSGSSPSTGASDDSIFTSNMWTHGPIYMQSPGSNGSSGQIGGAYLIAMNTDAGRDMVEQLSIVNYDATAGAALTNPRLGFAARGSGAAGAETAYFATLRLGSNLLEIYKRTAGADVLLASTAYTFTAGYDYYLKLRVSGTASTLLQLTCWRGDEEPPTAVTLSHTDSTSPITAAGYAGPIWHLAGSHAKGLRRLGFYAAGTSGDVAPMPVSFRKMADWLMNDTGERVVLAGLYCAGSTDGTAAGGITLSIAQTGSVEFISGPTDFQAWPNHLIGGNQTSEDILLEAPNFTARSNDSLTGRASLSYGDAIVANENGERDDWLRYNWDGREARVDIGGRGWPRWDFFRVITATVTDVYAPSPGRLGFKLRDNAVLLDRRIQEYTVGGTGPNAGKYTSVTLGKAFNVPLVLYDANTLRYFVNDDGNSRAPSTLVPYISDIRNNGGSLTKVGTVTAVNSGTDTITVVAHGGKIGSLVMFTAGTPPTGITLNWFYKINTVPSADTFTLEYFGSIVDLTTTTTGATVLIQNWVLGQLVPSGQFYVELVASPGSGTLTADLGGHYNISLLSVLYGAPPAIVADNVQQAITYIAQHCGGNFAVETYGTGKLDNMPATVPGFHSVDEVNGLDAMDEVVTAVGASWAVNSMGRIYAAVLTLPAAAFDYELLESDIDYDSFKPERIIYPQPVQQLGYQKNYTVQTNGLGASLSVAEVALYGAEHQYTVLPSTTGVDASAGLDVASNHLLGRQPENLPTVLYAKADADAEATRMAVMRSKMLVVFTMRVRAYQIFFQLGERVKVTHPRYGFENGEIGVIVGRTQNFLNNGVTLQVMFRLNGRWPTNSQSPGGASFIQVDDFYKVTAP